MAHLSIAVLTVSDTRTRETDTSGDLLASYIETDRHNLIYRCIVHDDIYDIRAIVSKWIADPEVDAIITTGGTGFSGRDSTPEALEVLFDKYIHGFGEMFRHASIGDIGSSTIQSRAVGGIANNTLIFALPGSNGACKTGWEKVLHEQLDESFRPCNFAELIPKLKKRTTD